MSEQNLFSQRIGLAFRAGKLVTGDEKVLKAIRTRVAEIVIVAEDASKNAIKKYQDKCEYYDVPILIKGSRQQLGTSIGKDERVVLAVTESGFADLIRNSL